MITFICSIRYNSREFYHIITLQSFWKSVSVMPWKPHGKKHTIMICIYIYIYRTTIFMIKQEHIHGWIFKKTTIVYAKLALFEVISQ